MGIAKLICMSKVRNFSEIAPDIAFSEFNYHDLIFLTLKHAINVKLLRRELYPRPEKQTRNPAETTGNRYKIEILMSRTQKLKGLAAVSLRLKTLNDNP